MSEMADADQSSPAPSSAAGNGTFQLGSGTYSGEFVEEQGLRYREGHGKYEDANGEESYEGAWKQDAMHGNGAFRSAAGAVYEVSAVSTCQFPQKRQTGSARREVLTAICSMVKGLIVGQMDQHTVVVGNSTECTERAHTQTRTGCAGQELSSTANSSMGAHTLLCGDYRKRPIPQNRDSIFCLYSRVPSACGVCGCRVSCRFEDLLRHSMSRCAA